jgi:hypothetical protein
MMFPWSPPAARSALSRATRARLVRIHQTPAYIRFQPYAIWSSSKGKKKKTARGIAWTTPIVGAALAVGFLLSTVERRDEAGPDEDYPLKDRLIDSFYQLQQMREQYGPDVKKEVDETLQRAGEILDGGWNEENVKKAAKLLAEKLTLYVELRDLAFRRAMEQLKPYVAKNTVIREWVQNHKDVLKKRSPDEVVEKIKSASASGDVGELERYAQDAAEEEAAQRKKKPFFEKNTSIKEFVRKHTSVLKKRNRQNADQAAESNDDTKPGTDE